MPEVTILCKVEQHEDCKFREALWSSSGLIDCMCPCHYQHPCKCKGVCPCHEPQYEWHM